MNLLMIQDLNKHLDLTGTLPRYKGPFHIIGGRQDYIVYNSYDIKLLMPSAELYWIDDCGHWPAFEQPVVFYSLLSDILTRVK